MSNFAEIAARHDRLESEYRGAVEPRDQDRLFDRATNALGDLWAAKPGADASTLTLARYGIALSRGERRHRANDDDSEDVENWYNVDTGFDLVQRLQQILERIAVAEWHRT
ncbi:MULTISPECIES: hypothetical protein [unclassified Inquilinus]|uniref:hypothetical protein n=1 Tax=unclassified Inquilinus TaxID=2645927 RepID=UPI003F8F4848